MKKIKIVVEKLQKKNLSQQKKLEKSKDQLKFKLGDPSRLNIFW